MLFYFLRGGLNLVTLIELAIFLSALLIAICVHEFAHALASEKLGDPTARQLGRLTLNPRAHLDPLGTLMMLLTGFGWGKPVPFNPFNLSDPRRDSALISFAGPIANLLTAALFALPYRWNLIPNSSLTFELILTVVSLNIGLAVFNLIPIYPLDGFRIVGGLLPDRLSLYWQSFAHYGLIFLLFLVLLPSNYSLIGSFVVPLSRTILKLILGYRALAF